VSHTGSRRKVHLRHTDRQHRGRSSVSSWSTVAAISSVPWEPTSILCPGPQSADTGRRTTDRHRASTANRCGGRGAGHCLPRCLPTRHHRPRRRGWLVWSLPARQRPTTYSDRLQHYQCVTLLIFLDYRVYTLWRPHMHRFIGHFPGKTDLATRTLFFILHLFLKCVVCT